MKCEGVKSNPKLATFAALIDGERANLRDAASDSRNLRPRQRRATPDAQVSPGCIDPTTDLRTVTGRDWIQPVSASISILVVLQ